MLMDLIDQLFIPERTIYVVKGKGHGVTETTAYDSALMDAGIGNLNIGTKLSSVIPSGYTVQQVRLSWNQLADGEHLVVVESSAKEARHGYEAIAMLGWVQHEGGFGIFLEHHGSNYFQVYKELQRGLEQMCAARGIRFNPQTAEERIRCETEPVCALVSAIYRVKLL